MEGHANVVRPGPVAASGGPRVVLPEGQDRRRAARHLLRRGDDVHSQFKDRGHGHLPRLLRARHLHRGAQGREQQAGGLLLRPARAGYRHQVGGLPRGRARRLRPLAQGTPAAVPWGTLDLRGRLRGRRLRRGAHLCDREPLAGVAVDVGLARQGGGQNLLGHPPRLGLALVELADHAQADTLFLRGQRGGTVAGGYRDREPPDLVVRHACRVGRHLRRGAQGCIQEALGGRPDDTDRPRLRVSPGAVDRGHPYTVHLQLPADLPIRHPGPILLAAQGLEPPGMGTMGGRRLRRLRRGARCILPSPGHSAAHKRRRPHEPRVDRLLVPLRKARSRERLPGPEPHLSVPPVRLTYRGSRRDAVRRWAGLKPGRGEFETRPYVSMVSPALMLPALTTRAQMPPLFLRARVMPGSLRSCTCLQGGRGRSYSRTTSPMRNVFLRRSRSLMPRVMMLRRCSPFLMPMPSSSWM